MVDYVREKLIPLFESMDLSSGDFLSKIISVLEYDEYYKEKGEFDNLMEGMFGMEFNQIALTGSKPTRIESILELASRLYPSTESKSSSRFSEYNFSLDSVKYILIQTFIFSQMSTEEKINKIGMITYPVYRNIKKLGYDRVSFFIKWNYLSPFDTLKLLLDDSTLAEEILNKCQLEGPELSAFHNPQYKLYSLINPFPNSNTSMNIISNDQLKEFLLQFPVKKIPSNTTKQAIAWNIAYQSTLSLFDLLHFMNEKGLIIDPFKNYLVKAYDIPNGLEEENDKILNLLYPKLTEFREVGLDNRIYFYSDFFISTNIAHGKHPCDSTWEVEICKFLENNEIRHQKPDTAHFGQYYLNTKEFPDWVVGSCIIELFGYDWKSSYREKMESKKKRVNKDYRLISITSSEFLDNIWKEKIFKCLVDC